VVLPSGRDLGRGLGFEVRLGLDSGLYIGVSKTLVVLPPSRHVRGGFHVLQPGVFLRVLDNTSY
jgi:hypothetical protein